MTAVQLRRVSGVLNGGTPPANEEYWDGDVPWATPVDLAKVDGGLITSSGRTLTSKGLSAGSTLAPLSSVLLSTRAPIGYTALTGVSIAFNQGCKAVVPQQGRIDPKFLQYALIASAGNLRAAGNGSTFSELSTEALLAQEVPVWALELQRRIADFLDDRVSLIDRIIAARRQQVTMVMESSSRLSYDCVRGASIEGERRDCRLDWLGSVPQTWPVVSVGSQFTVELGKMLDDKRQTGDHRLPYLRNTNVQWDEISVDDLKEMDIPALEYSRYTVDAGDLLICEGGQPGRSAIWPGSVRPIGFQKALHRARSRGRSLPQWLLECLRVAVDLDVFVAASGQTTIAHLTNEQLRGQRFPFPEPRIQMALLQELNEKRRDMKNVIAGLAQSNNLLMEYKSSLITAMVSGELDVTTANLRIPG